jgi:hypothetical protein
VPANDLKLLTKACEFIALVTNETSNNSISFNNLTPSFAISKFLVKKPIDISLIEPIFICGIIRPETKVSSFGKLMLAGLQITVHPEQTQQFSRFISEVLSQGRTESLEGLGLLEISTKAMIGDGGMPRVALREGLSAEMPLPSCWRHKAANLRQNLQPKPYYREVESAMHRANSAYTMHTFSAAKERALALVANDPQARDYLMAQFFGDDVVRDVFPFSHCASFQNGMGTTNASESMHSKFQRKLGNPNSQSFLTTLVRMVQVVLECGTIQLDAAKRAIAKAAVDPSWVAGAVADLVGPRVLEAVKDAWEAADRGRALTAVMASPDGAQPAPGGALSVTVTRMSTKDPTRATASEPPYTVTLHLVTGASTCSCNFKNVHGFACVHILRAALYLLQRHRADPNVVGLLDLRHVLLESAHPGVLLPDAAYIARLEQIVAAPVGVGAEARLLLDRHFTGQHFSSDAARGREILNALLQQEGVAAESQLGASSGFRQSARAAASDAATAVDQRPASTPNQRLDKSAREFHNDVSVASRVVFSDTTPLEIKAAAASVMEDFARQCLTPKGPEPSSKMRRDDGTRPANHQCDVEMLPIDPLQLPRRPGAATAGRYKSGWELASANQRSKKRKRDKSDVGAPRDDDDDAGDDASLVPVESSRKGRVCQTCGQTGHRTGSHCPTGQSMGTLLKDATLAATIAELPTVHNTDGRVLGAEIVLSDPTKDMCVQPFLQVQARVLHTPVDDDGAKEPEYLVLAQLFQRSETGSGRAAAKSVGGKLLLSTTLVQAFPRISRNGNVCKNPLPGRSVFARSLTPGPSVTPSTLPPRIPQAASAQPSVGTTQAPLLHPPAPGDTRGASTSIQSTPGVTASGHGSGMRYGNAAESAGFFPKGHYNAEDTFRHGMPVRGPGGQQPARDTSKSSSARPPVNSPSARGWASDFDPNEEVESDLNEFIAGLQLL